MLAVNTEKQLELLIKKCENNFVCYTVFRVPDIGNAITAVALEPGATTQKIVSNIPLMLKQLENESI
jgi:hypothetical protein